MEILKRYLYTAMLAALASSIVLRISDSRYRKYIRFGAGLCLLLTLITPMLGLTGEITKLISEPPTVTTPAGESNYMGLIGQGMSQQIGDVVAERFSIPREKIHVKLTLDLTDLSAISLIGVDLTIEYPCDSEQIRDYMQVALDCPIEVIVMTGEKGQNR